jgi:3-oxoadipate enol-lactonase
MPFTAIRDIDVYHERRGSGPRLLFISGTGGDLRRTPNVFDYPLASRFEILAYDQRSLGQTTRRDEPCSMADYADDAAALLDFAGWECCFVMGVSFGGMVAQELMLRHPGRISRAVLCCTSSGGAGGASYPLHELSELSVDDYVKRLLELSDIRRTAEWQAANPADFQALIDQSMAARQIGAGEPGREAGARRQLEARTGLDTWDRLPSLDVPVLICGGRYDGIAPIANQEALHRQIRGSRMQLFEGGHQFLLQDTAAFDRILEFLES